MFEKRIVLWAAISLVSLSDGAMAQTLSLNRFNGQAQATVTNGTPAFGAGSASDEFVFAPDIALADAMVIPSADGVSAAVPEAAASAMEISGVAVGLNSFAQAQAVLQEPGTAYGGWLDATLTFDGSGNLGDMGGNAQFGRVNLLFAGGTLVFVVPGLGVSPPLAPGTALSVEEYIPSGGQVPIQASARCQRVGGAPTSTNVRALATGTVTEELVSAPTGTGFNTVGIHEPGLPPVYLPY